MMLEDKPTKNYIILENGIKHTITEFELIVLRISLETFKPTNSYELDASESLKSVFLDHLD